MSVSSLEIDKYKCIGSELCYLEVIYGVSLRKIPLYKKPLGGGHMMHHSLSCDVVIIRRLNLSRSLNLQLLSLCSPIPKLDFLSSSKMEWKWDKEGWEWDTKEAWEWGSKEAWEWDNKEAWEWDSKVEWDPPSLCKDNSK